MDTEKDPAVISPCVRMCTLDFDDICVGCFRSLDEITGWTRFSQQEKLAVLKRAGRRREERAGDRF